MNSKSKVANNIILETFFILIIVVVAGIVMMAFYKPATEINEEFQKDTTIDQSAKDTMQVTMNKYPSFFDGLLLTMLILLWIAVLVSAFMIDSHPAFFVVSLLLLIVLMIAGAIIGNGLEEISGDSAMSSASFPITTYIFSHFLLVLFIVGMSLMLVIYAKSRSG